MANASPVSSPRMAAATGEGDMTARTWAVDDADPEIVVKMNEFGDGIPAHRRREYTPSSLLQTPTMSAAQNPRR